MMNADTCEALNNSIAKWEGISNNTTIDCGPWNCALCKKFLYSEDCVGCPVFEKTGERGCKGSPYEEFYRALQRHGATFPLIAKRNNNKQYAPEEFAILKPLAEAELAFLKSLLPEDREENGQ